MGNGQSLLPGEPTATGQVQQQYQPGEIAPCDAPPQQGQYGRYYENLPEEIKASLKKLRDTFIAEGETARRLELKKCKEAREFWRGNQLLWWDELDQAWYFLGSEWDQKIPEDEVPKFEFILNEYQAFGLSIIAVLSQSVPPVQLLPQDAGEDHDVQAAEKGSDVIDYIQRNNDAEDLITEVAFTLWTDGKVATFTRYVEDGQRFGFKSIDVPVGVQQNTVGEPVFVCTTCATHTPINQVTDGLCPECGSPLDESNLQEPYQVAVAQQQPQRLPKGQEVIDIVGACELKTPLWAQKQIEFPYLIYSTEVHKSILRATYPHVADKIGPQTAGANQGDSAMERQTRMRLNTGTVGGSGINSQDMPTVDRAWFRPWAFYTLDDTAKAEELLRIFPDGCKVVFAGDVFCEAQPENMDQHWVVAQVLPGNGQNRPALGSSFIDAQKINNTMVRLVVENTEYGIPWTGIDTDALDVDAMTETRAQPGAFYPMTRVGNLPLKESMFQSTPSQISPDANRLMDNISGPLGQLLTGAFPALMGAPAPNTDTAAGFRMQRDQAMGRAGLAYRAIKRLWIKTMLNGIGCFQRDRRDDAVWTELAKGNRFIPKSVAVADMRDGNVIAYPESDDQFPLMWTQQRDIYLQLLESQDEEVQNILGHPDNIQRGISLIGLEGFEIPDEDSRNKQAREIAQLTAPGSQPAVVPPDPLTGAPQQIIPTVEIDEWADNHEVELQVVKAWLNSPEGQQVKLQSPVLWENVKAHGMLHQEVLDQQQQAAMLAQAVQAAAAAPPRKGQETK